MASGFLTQLPDELLRRVRILVLSDGPRSAGGIVQAESDPMPPPNLPP